MANYSILDIERFEDWKQNKSSYYSAYEQARKKMLKKIEMVNVKKATNLENILNQIITSQQFNEDKITEQFLNKLPSAVEKAGTDALSKLQVEGFKVYTKQTADAWTAYSNAYRAYKQLEENSAEQIKEKENVDALFKQARSLQGSVNKAQGDIFEAFLQETIPLIADKIEEIGQGEINNLIADLEKNISNKSVITTQGSQTETIQFDFGEKKIKITSQGKVDATVDAPFMSEDFPLRISAKNYSRFGTVHLLGGGNVLGLVSQWPITSISPKRYFLNALTVWESPYEVLRQGRMLFGIQSLAGRGGKAEMANVLIINNRNSKKHPIHVISIKEVLEKVATPEQVDNAFNIKYTPQLQLFKKGEIRTQEKYNEKITSVKIDTSMNKAYLTLEYLRKAQK